MRSDAEKTKAELIAELEALRETLVQPVGDEAVRALRESEKRYRIVTEISRDAIEVINEAGDTVYVNPAVEELFGYTHEECIGKKFREWMSIVHPDDFDLVSAEFEQVEKREGVVHYSPMRILHKDGHWVWIKAVATAYWSMNGERYILEVSQDITEQVEAEQRRHRLEEQTREARRLESLGVLAGGIAHDFNNILVSVLGYADLALHDLPKLSPVRPLIEKLKHGGMRAAALSSQMLAYSGERQLTVGAVDLNTVVQEMSHLLAVSVSKKAAVHYELAPQLPAVEADETQLSQVAMNLIVNSSEAIGEKPGAIRVSTGVVECDRDRWKSAFFSSANMADGAYVFLEVSDTGDGMDDETKAKIFDPFFTTKFSGRGLGLATVLGITRSLEGAIELESEPGKGTTLRVLLPAIQQPAEQSTKRAPAPKDGCGTGSVLLVDDEETVLAVGGAMLGRLGFKVLTAMDGHEAVEVFRKHHSETVCVVLDLMMPNMDGAETLRELRKIRDDVKVVLSSGYHEQDLAERLAEMSFEGFLKKPYTSAALADVVRQAIDRDD